MSSAQFSTLALRVTRDLDAWAKLEAAAAANGAVLPERARAAVCAAEHRRTARERRLRKIGAAASFAVVLLVGGLFFRQFGALDVTVGADKTPYSLGDWASASTAELPLEFSDGSQLVLAPQTRARVVSAKSNGATIFIESGSAKVNVVPRRDSSWALSLGPFAVHVTGTEFDVAWDPETDEFELTLRRGSVTVSGCVFGDGRRISPNETVRASCGSGRYEVQRTSEGELTKDTREVADEPAEAEEAVRQAREVPARRASPAAAVLAGTSWQELAKAGKYSEAFKNAQKLGFDKQLRRLSGAELTTLAGVARYAGRIDKSQQAYQAIRTRFAGTTQASAAAYSLARIAFDQQAAYSEAASWFGTYLAEAPSGSLAREALGRRMEAYQRAGQQAAAVRTARRYLKKYRDGPHAVLASSMLASKE